MGVFGWGWRGETYILDVDDVVGLAVMLGFGVGWWTGD